MRKNNNIKKENNNINSTERKIIRLDLKLKNIFDSVTSIQKNNIIYTPISIKYKFSYEFDYGFIEYKRTLVSYSNKTEKLLRQIYWRIYESINYPDNINPKCYYIIGLEDDGCASDISIEDLNKSLDIIKESIKNTEIKMDYLFLFNELYKSYLLVIKLCIDTIGFDYF